MNKGKEKLAFVNVDTFEPGVLNVDYASTIAGREDYRGLFLALMQTMIEDTEHNFDMLKNGG